MKNPKLRQRLGIAALLVVLLVVIYAVFPVFADTQPNTLNGSDTVTISKDEYDRLQRYESLDEIAQIVKEYFYIEPDEDAMLDGAKRGLLAGLRDPYTFYYSPDEYDAMWEDDEGEYAGIGIQISASYETYICTIIRVFSNSPAYDAGIRKGDILYKVEDLDVDATTLNDAVDIMRGETGTLVHVQVMRDGELLDFDIPRAVVHVNWVSSGMLDSQVGYIQLYEFAGDCAKTFQTQLDTLLADGAQALIIDLRDNPGGWIDSAVEIADIFLPEETITYLEYRSGEREYYNATEGALQIPLVILVNGNSASASEILSGAMQDYGLATIVGTQSYGKGCVQFVLPLGNDDGGMQLTAALYYTPNGRSIHKIGITPDVEVDLPNSDTVYYEFGGLSDVQLQKAYDIALEKIAGTFSTPVPSAVPSPDAAADTAADRGDSIQSEVIFRVS